MHHRLRRIGYAVFPIALSTLAAACGNGGTSEPELGEALVRISAGLQHSCGLTADGVAYCWGWNRDGQLGDGSTVGSTVPVAVGGDLRFQAVEAGGGHSCGITTDGAVYCWGLNLSGQLGDGTNTNRRMPVPVSGTVSLVSLVTGGAFSCGLAAGGEAYCWGWNNFGQLGDGTTTDRNVPTAVAGTSTFETIAVENTHTCGLTTTGEAYCWGRNERGQLGTGDLIGSPTPTAVSGAQTFTGIALGDDHTCGVVSSGAVSCWGRGNFGQTATGAGGADTPVPTTILGGLAFDAVLAGGDYSCGLAGDGTVYCWGLNDLGQHGSLSPTVCTVVDEFGQVEAQFACTSEPFEIESNLRFRRLDLGAHHTCGVTVGSALGYCWGSGVQGELGNGQSGDSYFTVEPQVVVGQPGAST